MLAYMRDVLVLILGRGGDVRAALSLLELDYVYLVRM